MAWLQSIGIQLSKLMPKQRLTKIQKKAVEILTEHGKTEYEFDEKTGIQLPNQPHIKAVTIQALIDKGLLVKVKETSFASKPEVTTLLQANGLVLNALLLSSSKQTFEPTDD